MMPVTEPAVRSSFVNCTRGEAKRIDVPWDLAGRPWADLDFLGWRDPAAPQRAYLVAEPGTGPAGPQPSGPQPAGPQPAGPQLVGPPLVGVVLRVATRTGLARRSMCSLCLTTHSGDGVALMSARKAGPAGRQGDSVGAYLCSDLACSLSLRGRTDAGRSLHETLTLAEKVDRLAANLDAFLQQVRAG